MVKNKVFLLLPLTKKEVVSEEQVYLKVETTWDEEKISRLADRIKSAMATSNHESFDKIFDQEKFNDLKTLVKTCISEEKKRPSVVLKLEAAVKDMVHFDGCEGVDAESQIVCNHVALSGMLLNAYCNVPERDDVVLMDADASSMPMEAVEIVDKEGKEIPVKVIHCDERELYEWFTTHRNPQRELDKNYKKHSKESALGKKGVVISPLKCTEEEGKKFLRKAVGAERNSRNLFYLDESRDVILVFWNEGLKAPTYHAYEISVDDQGEIQKIYKKGHRELMKKIERVAKYERND